MRSASKRDRPLRSRLSFSMSFLPLMILPRIIHKVSNSHKIQKIMKIIKLKVTRTESAMASWLFAKGAD